LNQPGRVSSRARHLHRTGSPKKEEEPMKTKSHKTIKHGQQLLAKVAERRTEIERTLALVQADTMSGQSSQRAKALEEALASLDQLLACDLEELPSMAAGQLSQWLELTKSLPATSLPHAKPQHAGAPL
jgi:hypothetical protein